MKRNGSAVQNAKFDYRSNLYFVEESTVLLSLCLGTVKIIITAFDLVKAAQPLIMRQRARPISTTTGSYISLLTQANRIVRPAKRKLQNVR